MCSLFSCFYYLQFGCLRLVIEYSTHLNSAALHLHFRGGTSQTTNYWLQCMCLYYEPKAHCLEGLRASFSRQWLAPRRQRWIWVQMWKQTVTRSGEFKDELDSERAPGGTAQHTSRTKWFSSSMSKHPPCSAANVLKVVPEPTHMAVTHVRVMLIPDSIQKGFKFFSQICL